MLFGSMLNQWHQGGERVLYFISSRMIGVFMLKLVKNMLKFFLLIQNIFSKYHPIRIECDSNKFFEKNSYIKCAL